MADREWMLNPQAIRVAKKCIALVKEEFGEKLTLSDPMFMQSMHQFVELSDSRSLGAAYGRLLSMAGVGNVIQSLRPKSATATNASSGDTVKAAVGADIQR